MEKLPTCVFSLAFVASACSQQPPEQTAKWGVSAADDAPDSVSYAAGYVIYDLVQRRSPTIRAIRARCEEPKGLPNPCDDHGASLEAVIGLLGAGGDATTEGLLKTMAIQLDAGPAESRECEIGRRGKSLLPALRHLNADDAATWCKAEVSALGKRQLADLKNVPVGQICRPSAEIERDRQDWIKNFEAGQEGCGSE